MRWLLRLLQGLRLHLLLHRVLLATCRAPALSQTP